MRKALLLWALLNFQVKQGDAELTVAKLFSSGMVLQEAPATATIFGSYTEVVRFPNPLATGSGLGFQYPKKWEIFL